MLVSVELQSSSLSNSSQSSLIIESSLSYSNVITKRPFRRAAEVIDGRISGLTFV